MNPKDLHFHVTIGISKSRLDAFQKLLTDPKMKMINLQITVEPKELEDENLEFCDALRELLLTFLSKIRHSSIGPVM